MTRSGERGEPRDDRLVDRHPVPWICVVLLLAAVHLGRGFQNVSRAEPFGWFDLIAATTFVSLALWTGLRWRAMPNRRP